MIGMARGRLSGENEYDWALRMVAPQVTMTETIAPQTHLALGSYQNALSFLAENRPLEAMVEIRRCLASDPEFYDGQFLKARIHRLLGQYEEALPILEGCLQSLSEDVDVLREAAEVTSLAGKDKSSLKFYRRLFDLDPEDEDVCARLVGVAFHLAGPRFALKKVRICLKKNPDWPAGYLCLGNLLEMVGKTKQAEEAYRGTLRRVPDHRGARKCIERLYRGEPIEKGLHENSYEELFLSEAVRLARDGLATRSIRMLEEWRPKFRHHPEFLEVLAKTAHRLGRRALVLSAIREIPAERRNPSILLLEARTLAAMGDYESAATRYARLSEERPDSPEYWLEYLKVLSKTEQGMQAARAVEEALERLPNEVDLWFEAARIRKRYVDAASCVEALQRVVDLQPNHSQALYALGVEKLLSGDAAGAVPPLSTLTRMDRDRTEGWRHLAIAYTRLKDWKKAHACWLAVIRLSPTDPQAAGNLEKLDRMFGPVGAEPVSIRKRQAGSA